jgi:hypothetical protein
MDLSRGLGDVYKRQLLAWLADNVSRCHFDDVDVWAGDAVGSDIADLAQRRQREAIDTMAHAILQGLADLVAA